MAESKGALLAKSVQKHAGRAKEKILQNLGKVDRTADDIFDEHLQNFTRQQNAANRLQKDFNNYIRCIRAVQTASKTLMDTLNEVYESNWSGHDLLYVQAQNIEMLWQDFSHKMGDQVLIPLNTYQSQFPEMRKKVDKRGRKLVDFDSQRHTYQALQNNPKKRDDVKVSRARETLEEAKRTYEVLNSELHDELPALHDSRVLFLVTNLQTLFSAEQVFHAETAKVYSELEAIVDKLATDCQRGSYTLKKTSPKSPKSPTGNNNLVKSLSSSQGMAQDEATANPPNNNSTPTPAPASASASAIGGAPPLPTSAPPCSTPEPAPTPSPEPAAAPTTAPAPALVTDSPAPSAPPSDPTPDPAPIPAPVSQVNSNGKLPSPAPSSNNSKHVEELYDIPVGATTENLPPGVLYRVKATYKYNREDVDELSFDVNEIIRVVEYDDPEEQEEGWLMGVKETTGEKGMFPANFTRPL